MAGEKTDRVFSIGPEVVRIGTYGTGCDARRIEQADLVEVTLGVAGELDLEIAKSRLLVARNLRFETPGGRIAEYR